MRRQDFLRFGAAALTGAAVGQVWQPAQASPGAAVIPNVDVVDQGGSRFRFYDDLILGRAVLVNFFFTSCGDTCPLVTQNLREVQDLLGDRMGRDVFIYSISLQPELETPEVLAAYAAPWEVRPGWRFLTGRPDDIERVRKAMGFASSDPAWDQVKDNHTGMVRYGNDRLDRWAGTAGLGRPAWIASQGGDRARGHGLSAARPAQRRNWG